MFIYFTDVLSLLSSPEPTFGRDVGLDQEILEGVADSALIIKITNTAAGVQTISRGSSVAISPTRAITALHGQYALGTAVRVTDKRGVTFNATVGFIEFYRDNVDIAVLNLDPNGSKFCKWTPYTLLPVCLTQRITVVGLKEVSGGYLEVSAQEASVTVIESRPGSTLFQSTYYSEDGYSGSGVVTANYGGVLRVVGVHIAAHDCTVGINHAAKPTVTRLANDLQSITSELHGHTAYCLVCEIHRVNGLQQYLAT